MGRVLMVTAVTTRVLRMHVHAIKGFLFDLIKVIRLNRVLLSI